MAIDAQAQAVRKPSISSLITGILMDAKNLFARELELARLEIQQDIRKTKAALAALAIGLGTLGIGVMMLVLMIVHLIDASTELPLWGCYGIVGLVMTAAGAVVLVAGKNKAADVDFIPQKTAEAVKEDVGWIKARMMSNKIARTRAQP